MRGGLGPSGPQQQFLALRARRKHLGPLAVGVGLKSEPLLERDRLPETSSLHDARSFRKVKIVSCDKAYASPGSGATTNIN
jgi:hypothetical protein